MRINALHPAALCVAALALSACMGGGSSPAPAAQARVPADPGGAACQAAVSQASGRSGGDVIVYHRVPVAGGNEWRATVAGADRTWRCIVTDANEITQVGPV